MISTPMKLVDSVDSCLADFATSVALWYPYTGFDDPLNLLQLII